MKIDNDKLEIAMAKKCINLTELSESSGVGIVTLCRMKKRMQITRPATIGRISQALGVDVTEIIED